jgi:hypothetical protein
MKTKKTKPKFKAVYIEWIDSFSLSGSSWKDEADIQGLKEGILIIREIGFVVDDNENYITLVGGYDQEGCNWEPTYHRDVKIPKGCIMKKIDLTRYI